MPPLPTPTPGETDPGARWLRCDLHVHTPFDGEKKFGEDIRGALEALKKEDPKKVLAIAERFVDACRAAAGGAGMDVVAVTDHNSIDGYRTLKPHFDVLAQSAGNRGLKMPAILPGVELSVGGERPIHFLVVFSAATPSEQIDGCIRHTFGTRERFHAKTGTPHATGESIDEFLRRLYAYCHPPTGERRLEFVILPAHAEGNAGVARETGAASELSVATTLWDEMRGHLREWAVSRTDWNGFQTSHPFENLPPAFKELLVRWIAARRGDDWETLDDAQKRRYRDTKHWPLVECSDPHKYEKIGSRFSWLKMEVADAEGIRLALLDPESRLRRMDAGPPERDYPRITRVRASGTDFFDDVTLAVSPCLTTFIGGRGSGKSTLIEYLRFGLDRAREDDLDHELEDEVAKSVRSLLSSKKERNFGETPGTLLPGWTIEIDVRVSGRLYRVRRTESGFTVTPDPDGKDAAPAALDVRTLIRPRVLSQRQIARIARNPMAQREELDALLEPELLAEWDGRRRALHDEIATAQAGRSKLAERAKTLPTRETELKKIDDQVAYFEKGGAKETLATFASFQAESRFLKEFKKDVDARAEALTAEGAALEALRDSFKPPEGPTKAWISGLVDGTKKVLSKLATGVRAHGDELAGASAKVSEAGKAEWNPKYEEARRAYDEAQRDLKERGIDVTQHEKLIEAQARLRKDVDSLRTVGTELDKAEARVGALREQLVKLHEERLGWRRERAAALDAADADVRLDVNPFRDRGNLADRREEWAGGAGLQQRDWDVLVDHVFEPNGSVTDRWKAVVEALRRDLDASRATGRALDPGKSALAVVIGTEKAKNVVTGKFWTALVKADKFRTDEMERFLPEDEVRARVRSGDKTFKPIAQGSVGERSTAILSLLLSSGNQPLIIDQPEDDLDNRYIYDVVVDLLRKRKFSRQIIIASHNANIPVNGDAELIVAIGVTDRLGSVIENGSIDKQTVKTCVSEIMEGSAEAFRLRRERYGY